MEEEDFEMQRWTLYRAMVIINKQHARIAALEADVKRLRGERWEPVTADEKHEQEGKEILIENQGAWVGIRRIGVEGRDAWHGVWLNELGCVVCKKVTNDHATD